MTVAVELEAGAARHGAGTPRLLMCRPDYFDSHFLFNPYMPWWEKVDRRRARAQWKRLVRVLEAAGAEIEFLQPEPTTSALPFTADGAVSYAKGRAVVLRNDGPRGVLEPESFGRWFRKRGYEVATLPPGLCLDGGNILLLEDGSALAGIKPGSGLLAEQELANLIRAPVRPIALDHPRIRHLDLAVGVLADGLYLAHLGALAGGAAALGEAEIIEVDAADAAAFACNVVVVGDVVVTGPVSDSLVRRVRRRGFEVERVDLTEFYKAGGGAKCLTLPLRPDEGRTNDE